MKAICHTKKVSVFRIECSMLTEIDSTPNHVAGCFCVQKDKTVLVNVGVLVYVGPYGDPIFSAEKEKPSSPW